MFNARRVTIAVAAIAVGAVAAALAIPGGDGDAPTPRVGQELPDGTADTAPGGMPLEAPTVRRVAGVPNVSNGLFALGSVWAVTSNRPDVWSRGALEAAVVRIDPSTADVEVVLDSPGVEPALSELGGRVWVGLSDRVVALDDTGAPVASVPFAPGQPGDQVAGDRYLWVVDHDDASVVAIDPETATILRTIDTGAFPVRPIAAFGHVWIPSIIDGTVTIIDEATLGQTRLARPSVSSAWLTDVTAVPEAMTGDEVWVTDVDGDLFGITAHGAGFGQVRRIEIDASINRIHVDAGRAFLLPVFGLDVLVLDVTTERLEARIRTEAIPFRAIVAAGRLWVAEDGSAEILTVIDTDSLEIRRTFEVGTNDSLTTGPQQPVVAHGEIWVPNRGDDAFFVIDVDPG